MLLKSQKGKMAFDRLGSNNCLDKMDTDDDSKDSSYSASSLRRWNSSPMINILKTSETVLASERPRRERPRTYSASMYCSAENDKLPHTITPVGSPASRVIQLKQEESIDEMTREVLSERNVTSELQLSQSWGEMSLLTEKSHALTDEKRSNNEEAKSTFSSPVASPSPIRISNEQRLSRARSLTPSPGPLPISPRNRTIRRSLSPSGLRPSAFTSKRKLDPDDTDQNMTPNKRLCNHTSSISSASTCSSPDHHFDAVHISFDEDSSSDQSYTNSTTTTISPINVNNSGSFFYESKHSQAFSFLKPRYVAPPSPLAAGIHSASMQNESRKNSFQGSNYTFTPVKD